ncbi:MAG: 4a-hydroxytetrahydrobiopterin dehydratase, partial [Akkermansiaceae bacterium]|nr:4a-hydroxytetrahydrobiopterin dehydratase [Akkermansiaceae bacterium]
MSDLIPADNLAASLRNVPEWELEDRVITRTLQFGSFAEAIDFVNDLAEIAEVANHHPDIEIRYSRVTLR